MADREPPLADLIAVVVADPGTDPAVAEWLAALTQEDEAVDAAA